MRHEQIADVGSYDRVEIAAEAAGPVVPTAAAPDVPAAAGALLAASYAALVGAFALVTVASPASIFAIAVCFVFLAAFFAVPFAFLAVEPKQKRRIGFEAFLRKGMETLTGHSSGGAALVQMLMVPVLLTFGVLLIGLAKALIL